MLGHFVPWPSELPELRIETGFADWCRFVAGVQLSGLVTGSIPYKLMLEAVSVIIGL